MGPGQYTIEFEGGVGEHFRLHSHVQHGPTSLNSCWRRKLCRNHNEEGEEDYASGLQIVTANFPSSNGKMRLRVRRQQQHAGTVKPAHGESPGEIEHQLRRITDHMGALRRRRSGEAKSW